MGRKKTNIATEDNVNSIDFESHEMPVIIKTMDAQPITWNVAGLIEKLDNGEVNFEVPVQRGYVWNKLKDSELIRSLIRGIPINPFYYNKVEGVYEGLEGKQRSNAIYNFAKGLFALHAKTPPVIINGTEYQLARKSFEQLHPTIQNRITGSRLDGYWFDNMTLDEKVEFFILTNSGKPVTPAEISRIRIKSRSVFLSLVQHEVFEIALTINSIRKCRDEDIANQLWCMCYNTESTSLLQKDIGKVLAENEVSDEQKNELVVAFDYLFLLYKSVLSNKKLLSKMKKPTHILSLAYMAFLARKEGMSSEEYIERAKMFFAGEGKVVTISSVYNESVLSGSAKPEQMSKRIGEIKKALLG